MDKHCFNCGAEVRENKRYCPECGVDLSNEPKTEDDLVREMRQFKPESRKPKREPEPPNKFDEGVSEFFSSRTFKTLITLFLSGICCIALAYFSMAGAFITLITSIFSIFSQ